MGDPSSDEFKRRRHMRQKWHERVNKFHEGKIGSSEWRHWMYEAMDAFQEVPRLVAILRQERLGELEKLHQQCSMSPTESIQDNHLSCCLGVECRKCPELLALEKAELPPEQIDEAKAWTCATHILMEGGDRMHEGYLLTVGDRMYWDRLHESLAQGSSSTTGAK